MPKYTRAELEQLKKRYEQLQARRAQEAAQAAHQQAQQQHMAQGGRYAAGAEAQRQMEQQSPTYRNNAPLDPDAILAGLEGNERKAIEQQLYAHMVRTGQIDPNIQTSVPETETHAKDPEKAARMPGAPWAQKSDLDFGNKKGLSDQFLDTHAPQGPDPLAAKAKVGLDNAAADFPIAAREAANQVTGAFVDLPAQSYEALAWGADKLGTGLDAVFRPDAPKGASASAEAREFTQATDQYKDHIGLDSIVLDDQQRKEANIKPGYYQPGGSALGNVMAGAPRMMAQSMPYMMMPAGAGAAYGLQTEMGAGIQEADAAGLTGGSRDLHAIGSGAIGASEALLGGLGPGKGSKLMRAIGKVPGGKFGSRLGAEMAQESGATIAGNVLAQQGLDPNRSTLQDVPEAIIGAGMLAGPLQISEVVAESKARAADGKQGGPLGITRSVYKKHAKHPAVVEAISELGKPQNVDERNAVFARAMEIEAADVEAQLTEQEDAQEKKDAAAKLETAQAQQRAEDLRALNTSADANEAAWAADQGIQKRDALTAQNRQRAADEQLWQDENPAPVKPVDGPMAPAPNDPSLAMEMDPVGNMVDQSLMKVPQVEMKPGNQTKEANAQTLESLGVKRVVPEVTRSAKKAQMKDTKVALDEEYKDVLAKYRKDFGDEVDTPEFWQKVQRAVGGRMETTKTGPVNRKALGFGRPKGGAKAKSSNETYFFERVKDKDKRRQLMEWARQQQYALEGRTVEDVPAQIGQTTSGVIIGVPGISEMAQQNPDLAPILGSNEQVEEAQGTLREVLSFLREAGGGSKKISEDKAVDFPSLLMEAVKAKATIALKDLGIKDVVKNVERQRGKNKGFGEAYGYMPANTEQAGAGQYTIPKTGSPEVGRVYADTMLEMANAVRDTGSEVKGQLSDEMGILGKGSPESRKLLHDSLVNMAADIYDQLGITMHTDGGKLVGSGMLGRTTRPPATTAVNKAGAEVGVNDRGTPLDQVADKEERQLNEQEKAFNKTLAARLGISNAEADAVRVRLQEQAFLDNLQDSQEPSYQMDQQSSLDTPDPARERQTVEGGGTGQYDQAKKAEIGERTEKVSSDLREKGAEKRQKAIEFAAEQFFDNPTPRNQQHLNMLLDANERLLAAEQAVREREESRAAYAEGLKKITSTGRKSEADKQAAQKRSQKEAEQAAEGAPEGVDADIVEEDVKKASVTKVDENIGTEVGTVDEAEMESALADLKDFTEAGISRKESIESITEGMDEVNKAEFLKRAKAQTNKVKTTQAKQAKKKAAKKEKFDKSLEDIDEAIKEEESKKQSTPSNEPSVEEIVEDAAGLISDDYSVEDYLRDMGEERTPEQTKAIIEWAKKDNADGTGGTPSAAGAAPAKSITFDPQRGRFGEDFYKNVAAKYPNWKKAIRKHGVESVGRDLAEMAEDARQILDGLSNAQWLEVIHKPQQAFKRLKIEDGDNPITRIYMQLAAISHLESSGIPDVMLQDIEARMSGEISAISAALQATKFFGDSKVVRYRALKSLTGMTAAQLQAYGHPYMEDLKKRTKMLRATLNNGITKVDPQTIDRQVDILQNKFATMEFANEMKDPFFANAVVQDFTSWVRDQQNPNLRRAERFLEYTISTAYSGMLSGTGTLMVAGIAGAPIQGAVMDAGKGLDNILKRAFNKIDPEGVEYSKSTIRALSKGAVNPEVHKMTARMMLSGIGLADIDQHSGISITRIGHGHKGRLFNAAETAARRATSYGSTGINYFDMLWENSIIHTRMVDTYGELTDKTVQHAHEDGKYQEFVREARTATLKDSQYSKANEILNTLLRATNFSPEYTGDPLQDSLLFTAKGAAVLGKFVAVPFAGLPARALIEGTKLAVPALKVIDKRFSKEWNQKYGSRQVTEETRNDPKWKAEKRYEYVRDTAQVALSAAMLHGGYQMLAKLLGYEELEEDSMDVWKKDWEISGKRGGGTIRTPWGPTRISRVAPQISSVLEMAGVEADIRRLKEEGKDVSWYTPAGKAWSRLFGNVAHLPHLEQIRGYSEEVDKNVRRGMDLDDARVAAAAARAKKMFDAAVFPNIQREVESSRSGAYLTRDGRQLVDPVHGVLPSKGFTFGMDVFSNVLYDSKPDSWKAMYDASLKAGDDMSMHEWGGIESWRLSEAGVADEDVKDYIFSIKEWTDKFSEKNAEPREWSKDTLGKAKKAALGYAEKKLSKNAKAVLIEHRKAEAAEKRAKALDKRKPL